MLNVTSYHRHHDELLESYVLLLSRDVADSYALRQHHRCCYSGDDVIDPEQVYHESYVLLLVLFHDVNVDFDCEDFYVIAHDDSLSLWQQLLLLSHDFHVTLLYAQCGVTLRVLLIH